MDAVEILRFTSLRYVQNDRLWWRYVRDYGIRGCSVRNDMVASGIGGCWWQCRGGSRTAPTGCDSNSHPTPSQNVRVDQVFGRITVQHAEGFFSGSTFQFNSRSLREEGCVWGDDDVGGG